MGHDRGSWAGKRHPHPTPEALTSPGESQEARRGQSTVGRARCPLHAQQGGRAGQRRRWACRSEMSQLVRALGLGCGRAAGGGGGWVTHGWGRATCSQPRVPSAAAQNPSWKVGPVHLPPDNSPPPPLYLLIRGGSRSAFPSRPRAGDEGTQPTSASDPTQAPAVPKVSSVHGTGHERWLPLPSDSLHPASRTSSPTSSTPWRSGPAHTCLSPGPLPRAPNSQSLSCLHKMISGNSV